MKLKVKPVFFKTDREKAEIILKSVLEHMPTHAEFTEESIINSFDDLPDFQQGLEDVDALLELTENLRPVPIRLYIRLGDFRLPIVVYGGEFYITPRRIEAAGYWKTETILLDNNNGLSY